MIKLAGDEDHYFNPLGSDLLKNGLPDGLHPFNKDPHSLGRYAAEMVQKYLILQTDWHHNFGLGLGQEGEVIGKMFGVLVVENEQKEVGFLAAYSGKLAGGYPPSAFVPPVFDGLKKGSFLNLGMTELTKINACIKNLEMEDAVKNKKEILSLKETRRKNSNALQEEIFDHYHFLNRLRETKDLKAIFRLNGHFGG